MILPIVMRLNLFRFGVFKNIHRCISIYITTAIVKHEQSNRMGNEFFTWILLLWLSFNLSILHCVCLCFSHSHSGFLATILLSQQQQQKQFSSEVLYFMLFIWVKNKNKVSVRHHHHRHCVTNWLPDFLKIVFSPFRWSISLFITLEKWVWFVLFPKYVFSLVSLSFSVKWVLMEFLLLWCFFCYFFELWLHEHQLRHT